MRPLGIESKPLFLGLPRPLKNFSETAHTKWLRLALNLFCSPGRCDLEVFLLLSVEIKGLNHQVRSSLYLKMIPRYERIMSLLSLEYI